MWLLCLKMRARIWGYLGQMAHRRQIAQWSGTRTAHRRQIAQWAGTRTTHPRGTGLDPGHPQTQGVRVPMPAGAFSAPENMPQGCSAIKIVVLGKNTMFFVYRK